MRLRIILAFHIALIYYTQDFRVYEGTRDQPMPGPFPAPPIFLGKSPGDEAVGCKLSLYANEYFGEHAVYVWLFGNDVIFPESRPLIFV